MGRPRKQWLLPLDEVLRRYGEGESSETLRVECGLSNVHPVLRAVREAGMQVRPAHGPSGRGKADPTKKEMRTCIRDGCDGTFIVYKSSNKRYCQRTCHYTDPEIRKLLDTSKNKHRVTDVDSSTLTGTCAVCGPNSRVRQRSSSKRYPDDPPSYRCWFGERERVWTKEYGLSVEMVRSMWALQGHRCAICRQEMTNHSFYVDHDHTTGAVRGLLCNGCNMGLGLLGDTVESIEAALRYLKCHQDR